MKGEIHFDIPGAHPDAPHMGFTRQREVLL